MPTHNEIDTNAIMQALPHLRDSRGSFIGIEGNIGCLRATTPVLDPLDGSKDSIEERHERGVPFGVVTRGVLGEPASGQTLPPARGPRTKFYRVETSDEESFSVTGSHRLLTEIGWMTVEALRGCVSRPKLIRASHGAPSDDPLGVARITPDGEDNYFDFHVLGTNSYEVGGVWHHNCGKSEAANMLARVRQAHDGPTLVLFEPIKGRFKELLGLYYADPARWGFTFQMHALQARFRQHTLAAEVTANGIDVIQDRTIYADGCFGRTVHEDGNMCDAEWGIYADTFGALKRFLRYPDVIVYLRTEPERCLERMRKRARTEEVGVPLDYLRRIHDKHEMLVDAMSRYTRVLRVDWNEFGDIEALNTAINRLLAEERPFQKNWTGL